MDRAAAIADRLDSATSHRRILEHPFYVAWAAGELTTEDLRFYAGQYWRQVEAFPGYLSSLASKVTDERARSTVNDNLSDEVDDDHAGLWIRFAEALGATRSEIEAGDREPETARCVADFSGGTSERSAAFGLGMLYGYESQTPAVAATKIEGLRNHYGIDGPALDYFELHGELDVHHSRELAEAIACETTTEDDVAEAEAGARAGAEALWRLLDGVARVREIAAA